MASGSSGGSGSNPGWVNGAAMPTDANPQARPLSPHDWRHFNLLRVRVLTTVAPLINLHIPTSTTNMSLTVGSPESDVFGISVTPNWNTTVWVTNKSNTQFTLNFGTAAPANASVDIFTFKTER